MKTNQVMSVKIGQYGVINIGHKTKMGKVQEVVDIANVSDRLKGGEGKYKIEQALKSIDLWKYIIEVAVLDANDGKSNYSEKEELEFSKKIADYSIIYEHVKNGEVSYGKLMKMEMFKPYIMSKRGKYGGTWANLQILLKIAGNADKAVEALAYKMLVESKLLQFRDNGGNAFKKLNILIDTLSDRKLRAIEKDVDISKANRNVYVNIAKLINEKINSGFDAGWNDEKKDIEAQKMRDKYLTSLCTFVEMGFVNSYNDLKLAVVKL